MRRRPTRAARGRRPASEGPRGWARPLAGWGQFTFMVVAGALFTAGGLAMALSGRPGERMPGVVIALFFFACLLTAPLFAPGRGRGRLRLETVWLGDRHERGLAVPASRSGTALAVAASACLALASLGFVVFAEAFADPGEPSWPPRVLGAAGVLVFGLGLVVAVRRGLGRRWRVLLTPSAVVVAAGRARTVVPWPAIREVRAAEVTTRVRGMAVREPLVGIDVADPGAIGTGPLERLLLPLSRGLAADVCLPVRTLDVEPGRLLEALRWYHRHPEARAELATRDGLARVRDGRCSPAATHP